MSNSLARDPRPGGAGPTRQQLDELDALLQRMLDLPVSQAEEPPDEPEPEPPAAPRPARQIPAPEPGLPPVRYYEPDVEFEDEDDSPPPGYPPTSTLVGALPSYATPVPRVPPAKEEPLGPRLMQPPPPEANLGLVPPVPGGRHDLEEDTPVDPTEELARIRAMMQEKAGLPPSANIPNAPRVEGEWVPLRSSWQPSAQTWKPLADRWEQSSGTDPRPATPAPMPPMPPRHTPSGPVVLTQTASEADLPPIPTQPPAAAPTEPRPAAAPQDPGTSRPWPVLPLVWFNAAFDAVLLAWCPRGKLLRGPGGRAFLGTLGILCLLAAGALVGAEWFGWPW